MLESITLKFTETREITLPVAGITVFVGPNNSGKSLLLRELESIFITYNNTEDYKILKDYEINWPSEREIDDIIKSFQKNKPTETPSGYVNLGRINPNSGFEAQSVNRVQISAAARERSDKRWWANHFMRWGVLRLDGRSRFNLTNDQSAGDLLGPPSNTLSHLFTDDSARLRVREILYDAFGLHFVIDPTKLGTLRIRLSSVAPSADEQSLNPQAREFHGSAIHIKDVSDGIQAFSGIVTAVLSGEFDTILVDEPEAFLHPPLARKLGKHLASLATQRGGALMASTHSSDFLMGCIQAGKSVRVVRLEYAGGRSRGKVVDSARLEEFLKRPLMRSANVISALFHDGVVVTESDNDRAFYAEIYYRMTEENGYLPSILFVNAQNKQTMRDIIGPLRQFGVPAAAISDVDILKDGGKNWSDWLRCAKIPSALHSGLGHQRSVLCSRMNATGRDMKSDGGINILDPDDRRAAEQFFDQMDSYGVFTVRHGELENWLPALHVSGKKTEWAVNMLERMGSDPDTPSYIRPSSDDVWEFMSRIVSWVRNPARNGT